jgi:N-sulfoglucosamine sulfohydrolase
MPRLIVTLLIVSTLFAIGSASSAAAPPNILIITVDDMSADSVGSYDCPVRDTTPNIDALAASGLRFSHAHVQVGNCMPSRNVMWSGRYPHNNGVEGFYQVKDATHPHLVDLMQKAGYFTAIRHKVSHSTPYHPYHWDLVLDVLPEGKKAHVKDAASYGVSTTQGIQAAKDAGRPFCLVINIADPHKPFYAQGKSGDTIPDPHMPSKVFTPEEMVVPGFLFKDPVVYKELAHYYSSVRRADDGVGYVLDALNRSGKADDTLVMFLSDHGMALPFAKTQVYHHSTHTPLIVRWPGVTSAGTKDDKHMVSAVDFIPTLLDVISAEHPPGIDGRSFASLLKGQTQTERDFIIKEYNENAGGSRDPMRAVQTKELLYIFNPWSNGQRVMATATSGTPTYRRMAELAQSDAAIAARHDLYQHRVPEELYDVRNDPDCLVNLIESPQHQKRLNEIRKQLESWMVTTNDHMLSTFRNRSDPDAREAYVLAKEDEAAARRAQNRKAKKQNPKSKPNAKARAKQSELISLQFPKDLATGQKVVIHINHKLPEELGEQLIHVTIKQGNQPQRIERQVLTVSGEGTTEVTFEVPVAVKDNMLSFAAFVGKDFQNKLQYLTTKPQLVKEQAP